ncbi:YdcF family protein [Shimazuella sp. AN120528]|uniref:YdcF family protein n=1 Tax=Shimazuella soli TaxID=1892854 RepID=UPI001F10DFE4|nr:YdcF family protein [Shimazuella soli]MCH5585425.1 YdcF family protein [Shimazuella soli]
MIPKCPDVPPLTQEQIDLLTKIVFLDEDQVFPTNKKCDLLFVFGGTHPGCWETAFEIYQAKKVERILVTGGIKPGAIRHSTWKYGDRPEAHVIREKLLELGVSDKVILIEDRSTDTLENITFAKALFDFSSIQTLGFVCKSYGAGRQWRTLQKQLPANLSYIPYPFDTSPWENRRISRFNWMHTPEGKSYVYGEYLRILHYGQKGDLSPLSKKISGL